jgi:hypothetical protein
MPIPIRSCFGWTGRDKLGAPHSLEDITPDDDEIQETFETFTEYSLYRHRKTWGRESWESKRERRESKSESQRERARGRAVKNR